MRTMKFDTKKDMTTLTEDRGGNVMEERPVVRSEIDAWVTPDRAKELLEHNEGNRNLDNTRILQYTKDILEGRWVNNHEPIHIDWNGRLVNGQHRLLSCIRAGKGIFLDIIWNVDPNIRLYLDGGKPRNLNEHLKYLQYPYPVYLSRISYLLYQCSRPWDEAPGEPHPVWKGARGSIPEMLGFIGKYPLMNHASIWVAENKYLRDLYVSPAIPGAALCLLARKWKAPEFFTRLRNMEYGDEHCPLKALNAMLMGWRVPGSVTAVDTHLITAAKLVFTGRIFYSFEAGRGVKHGKRPSRGSWSASFSQDWLKMKVAWFSPRVEK